MRQRKIAWLLIAALLISTIGLIPAGEARAAADKKICIVLDPGHGGTDAGATGTITKTASGSAVEVKVKEKDLALKVAEYTKEILEKDGRFEVYLTRETDKAVSLADRAAFARDKEADLLLSMHFNSAASTTANGAEIWESVLPKYQIIGLPMKILTKIHEKTGISASRGVKSRESESKTYWNAQYNWDTQNVNTGTTADYYGVVKGAAKWGIPSMIVEHAFLSNAADMECLTQPDDEGLKALAEADAEALIDFYTGHEHFYEVMGTEYPASCITGGRKASFCILCKAKKDISPIAAAANANAHFVDNYKVTKKATTTAEGSESGTCHYCGKTIVRAIAKLPTVAKPITTVKKTVKKVSKPAKAVVSKVKKKKNKQVTVTVKKVKNAAGYQYKFGSNKKLTKQKRSMHSKYTKVTIIKWKTKYCYVKVRAYRTDSNGKKVYGKWSSVKRS